MAGGTKPRNLLSPLKIPELPPVSLFNRNRFRVTTVAIGAPYEFLGVDGGFKLDTLFGMT